MKIQLLFLPLILVCSIAFGQKLIDPQVSPGEEVSFLNKGITITGSLLLPDSIDDKVPAIVFINGSGDGSFRSHFEEGASYTLFKDLADFFLNKGYAILLLEKRGINKSTGDWRKYGFDTYADDVYLAIRYLKARNEIDSENISLLGHSQGGYIGQVVAAKYPEEVASLINLAGPAESVYDQVIFDMGNQYYCRGYRGIKYTTRMLSLKASLAVAKAISHVAKPMFIMQVIRHDPSKFFPSISCPTLSIFAENDSMVDAIANTNIIDKLAGDKKSLHTIHTIKDTNHHFFSSSLCYEWNATDKTITPDLFKLMDDWLMTRNKHTGFNKIDWSN